ncbi:hypothetical protein SJ888_14030, partial [Enterococcus faecium]
MSIYNFETTLEDGTVYSLKKYAGKPIIIVNTATKCGLAQSSPDSCVKCYTMFLPFLLIKIDVF